MPELVHVTPDAPDEQIEALLRRDGGLVIDGLLDDDLLASTRAELEPYLDAGADGANEFGGFRTRRIGALMARSPSCRTLALHPTVNVACASVLGEFSDGYQLHFTQAVRIGPGETAQMLHRDRGVWGNYVPRRIETQVSTIWAIDDFTVENGATRIVPRSQDWDRDRLPEPDEIQQAEMRAGSLLLYTGTVLHGGGSNRTDTTRLGVLIHYTLSWLRQEENQYLSCPPEIAKDLDPELRALMGYSLGGAFLGFCSPPLGPGEGGELVSPGTLFA